MSSVATGFTKTDIIETLQALNMIKYWKGQAIFYATPEQVEEHVKNLKLRKPRHIVDTRYLRWSPKNKPKIQRPIKKH